ncbi:hypothetical protein J6G99_06010 [bacterium]|nr:hypothetical protein [bacterium]
MEISKNFNKPQFGARLVRANVKLGSSRWKNVEKIFKVNTIEAPNDKFIVGSCEDGSYYLTLDHNNNYFDSLPLPFKKLFDWVMRLSDEQLADRFTKLYKGMKLKQNARRAIKNTDLKDIHAIDKLERNYVQSIRQLYKDDKEMLNTYIRGLGWKGGVEPFFRENSLIFDI